MTTGISYRSLLLAMSGLLSATAAPEQAAAPGSAGAASASAASAQGAAVVPPEIIMTARKRDEFLQDVPIAIRAIDSRTIAREGLRTVEDLTRRVPGLTYDQGGFLNDTRPAVRGMQSERAALRSPSCWTGSTCRARTW